MTRRPMVLKSVRVPQPLWDEALRTAERREEALADVIRAALERYVKRHRVTELDPDLDPYRCPECDRPAVRSGGPSMRCTEHGQITPVYDEERAHRLSASIPAGDDD